MEDRDSEGLGKKGAANSSHPFFMSYSCAKIKAKKYWSVVVME